MSDRTILWGMRIVIFVLTIFFAGYYKGKQNADEWYAKHPVVETKEVVYIPDADQSITCTGPINTFHHEHVTVYREGKP